MEVQHKELFYRIECMLFVAGDPVSIPELARVLSLTKDETRRVLTEMEAKWLQEGRGVQLLVTEDTAQLISNREYLSDVELLLNPQQKRSVSQSLMETLAVVAYRQPVTRADIEAVRGVRCDYAVSQLLRMGLIAEAGRRDVVGRPMEFSTTDRFLRYFGLHSIEEMPEFFRFSQEDESAGDPLTV